MDAKELRIGNWVRFPFTGYEQVGDVQRLEQDSGEKNEYYISSVNDRFPRYFDMIEPIPLTPEWLERFDLCGVLNTDGGTSIYIVGQSQDIETAIPVDHIKYVHQLQNLYFALTGKELELKSLATPGQTTP